MTSFPRSPRTLRGALVTIDANSRQRAVIEFQYNPETLSRRIEPRGMGGEGGSAIEVYRLAGPPKETISFTAEIDAAGQLEIADPLALSGGIHSQLAALEQLVYPRSADVAANAIRAQQGDIEIIPPEAPLTLLVWGPNRVLPVRVASISVTEELHDTNLNPIRARVELSLQVLSYADFRQDNPGYHLFQAHHVAKELLAASSIGASIEHLGEGIAIP